MADSGTKNETLVVRVPKRIKEKLGKSYSKKVRRIISNYIKDKESKETGCFCWICGKKIKPYERYYCETASLEEIIRKEVNVIESRALFVICKVCALRNKDYAKKWNDLEKSTSK